MKIKKIYIAPELEFLNLDIPSILAGTGNNSAIDKENPGTGYVGGGGEAGGDDEILSRRGGFWDDEDF